MLASDQINAEVKVSVGVRDVAMPYVSQFFKAETTQQEVTAPGVKFEFTISQYGSPSWSLRI